MAWTPKGNLKGPPGDPAPGTDLSIGAGNSTTLRIDSSTGSNALLTGATINLAGLMTANDKIKLDSIEFNATAGANWNTNLSNIPTNIVSWANVDPTSKQNSGFITGGSTYARFHSTAGDSVGGALYITSPSNFSYRIDGSEYFTVSALGNTIFGGPSGSTYARPRVDNAIVLGGPSNRWSAVYAASGSINTSDAREKAVRGPLNEQELAAGLELASAAVIYQWNDAIKEKGEAARLHCGPTVQGVIAIMEAHGLNPFRYGFVCYDEWEEQLEVRDEETGEITQEYQPAGDRYSLRPDELAAFRDAALAQNYARIEARLDAAGI